MNIIKRSGRHGRAKRRRALGLAFAVAASSLVGITSLAQPSSAAAANLNEFDAGNIMSDEVFFDSTTMTEADVQQFLRQKLPVCRTGYTCLPDWRGDTTTQPADPECAVYTGAASESAARVITKVATACGINPRVLIVMLQKEQGLVTDTWPASWQWRTAMGYGCPDTAACDTQYYGFFNQVYNAAWQMKRYSLYPRSYSYQAFRVNSIGWHPNAACGASDVYISNQATANLYNYTPYQPNAAAIAAGTGTGDSCSAYGNRNFFNYFTDWFGLTTYDVPGGIGTYWRGSGSAQSPVGSPTSRAIRFEANGGGWAQAFTRGYIYLSPAGAAGLRQSSAIFADYATTGSQYGPFGWPRFAERCSATACLVDFTGGAIGWSASGGLHRVQGPIYTAYTAEGLERGVLGIPTSDELTYTVNGGGTAQDFAAGYVYASPAGSAVLRKSSLILQRYAALGSQFGELGWPTGSEQCNAASCYATFQNGVLGWTAAGGVQQVERTLVGPYLKAGGPTGPLGLPASPAETITASGGGVLQRFAGGTLYSAAGSDAALRNNSSITQRYLELGGPAGPLGWPTGSEQCDAATCSVAFQNGLIGWSSTGGIHEVVSPVLAGYLASGGPTGLPGVPISGGFRSPANGGGTAQDFAGGYVYVSPAGNAFLRKSSGILQRYAQANSQNGPFGWPAGSEDCTTGSCSVNFQNGVIAWTRTGGVQELTGSMLATYRAAGGVTGELGLPTSAEFATASNGGGRAQVFARGFAYASAAGVAYLRSNSGIQQRYALEGSQYGPLGWPKGPEVCTSGSCSVEFQHGAITWTPAAGVTMLLR